MTSPGIVIISPEVDTQNRLAGILAGSGFSFFFASTVDQAEMILRSKQATVIMCSEELPDGSFHDILRLSKTSGCKAPVIVFSRFADWDGYLQIVRLGAFDYVRYPTLGGEIERVVRYALDHNSHSGAMAAAAS